MRLKEIAISTLFYMILFVIAGFVFNPTGAERVGLFATGLSWAFYMFTTMLSILVFSLMPFTRKLLEGADEEYGVAERRYALIFFGMIALANAILLSNIISSLFIPNYAAG